MSVYHFIFHVLIYIKFILINTFVLKTEMQYVYYSKSEPPGMSLLQLNPSTGTPVDVSFPAPPDRPTPAVQSLRSRVCDRKHGIRLLVIVIAIGFVSILVGASVRLWPPQNKVL